MSKASAPFWISTFIIILFSAAVRFYALDTYPIRFNQDEMVMGYDAWSIWQTGHDHHGEAFPLFFRTFGDYVPPVANYLDAPFVGMLGLSEYSTRLPMAIMGVLTVLLAALLGREWFGPMAGIMAALFMAVEPWLVNYSRVAFPTSIVPFFTAAALYTFTKGIAALRDSQDNGQSNKTVGWLGVSALSFALLTVTYPVMKLHGPLLLLICMLAAFRTLWQHRWATFYWLLFFAILINPFISQQLFRWNTVQARFDQVSAINASTNKAASGEAAVSPVIHTIELYLSHYDPSDIFFRGFKDSVAVLPPGIGELAWFELPLLIGLLFFKKLRRDDFNIGFDLPLVLGLWLLTYPLADTLTGGFHGLAHELRAVPIFPLPELLAGYSAALLWNTLARYRRVLAYGAALVGGVSYLAFTVVFLTQFFDPGQLTTPQQPPNIGLAPMLDIAVKSAGMCDQIWIDDINQTYIYYLFLQKFPPRLVQSLPNVQAGSDVIGVTGIGQVRFGKPPKTPTAMEGCEGQPYRLLWVTRQSLTSDWTQLAAYRNATGNVLWSAVGKDAPHD